MDCASEQQRDGVVLYNNSTAAFCSHLGDPAYSSATNSSVNQNRSAGESSPVRDRRSTTEPRTQPTGVWLRAIEAEISAALWTLVARGRL